ncbi:hypothetical protein [Vreelandella stevensii]|uniref:hypothetical protein n=1 Tax=Vreelandella stevensii TaxID=502821 RepID=UPI00403A8C90
MKTLNKTVLSVAIAFSGMTALSSAHAFDSVTWVWDATVNSTVDTSALSDINVTPAGLTQTENDQTTFGALTSTSLVTVVDNLIIPVLSGNSIDDLASVESSATAVGNNGAITSDVSMQTDNSQLYAGVGLSVDPLITTALVPGTILASSSVLGVTNATVDSSSTGVANNLSLDLTTTSDQDAFAIANNEQLAVALVTSTSTVDAVLFDGIKGMANTTNAAVSSTATAVGNNLSVNVDGNF